jgi:CHAD domain-containing protein
MTVLSRAIRQNALRMTSKLPAASDGDRDAIHDVRVASRRLRAALPIAGEATRTDVRALVRDIRRVTRALSGLREADVVLTHVQAWPSTGPWSPLALARLEARCNALRDREHRTAREAVGRVDIGDLLSQARAIARAVGRDAEPAALAVALAGETRRRARALTDAIEETGIVYAVEPLHRIRLAAKKLRYVLEVGSRALAGTGPKTGRRLQALQTRLGDLHDMQILQQHVRAAAAEAAGDPALAADLAAMDRSIEVRCRQSHAAIMRRRAGLDAALGAVERAANSLIVPRALGRMARMHSGHRGRKAASG